MGNNSANVADMKSDAGIYMAFRKLARSERRKLALRILRDQRVLADLYDHFLIHKALRQRGKSVSWKEFRRASATA